MLDSQEEALANTVPGKKQVFRIPFYDILTSRHYKNLFEFYGHEIKYVPPSGGYGIEKGTDPELFKSLKI